MCGKRTALLYCNRTREVSGSAGRVLRSAAMLLADGHRPRQVSTQASRDVQRSKRPVVVQASRVLCVCI